MSVSVPIQARVETRHTPGSAGSLKAHLADRWTLHDTWRRVKRATGQAGPDRVTTAAFEGNLDQRIAALAASVATDRYRPGPIARQFLQKTDGGVRVIAIPNVADRLLQTAAGQWLQQLLEPRFLPCSFGYRPTMGPQRAALLAARLAGDHRWVVTADIEKYFDTVDHQILARLLRDIGVAQCDCDLVQSWLQATPVDAGTRLISVKGLPQGLTIAPPLANLYLHEFDEHLRDMHRAHVRFADDFVVFAHTEAEAIDIHHWIETYLRTDRKLKLKTAKTSVSPVANGFKFVGFRIDAAGLHIPAGSIARFKTSLNTRLQVLMTDLPTALQQVNDLVRGWRAYYGQMSRPIELELATLDTWRRAQTLAALTAAGQPEVLGDTAFESLRTIDVFAQGGEYGPEVLAEPADPPIPPTTWTSPIAVPPRQAPTRTPEPTAPVASQRRAKAVRDLAIGIKQRPWLTSTGDLVIPTHGAFVTRAGQTLIVKRKQQTVIEVPLAAIKHVSIIGAGVSLSGGAVTACLARGIRIWLVDRLGRAVGQLTPANRPTYPRVGRQLLQAAMTRRGTALARDLLEGKLKNQRALLQYYAKSPSRPVDLQTDLRTAAGVVRAGLADLRRIDGPLRTVRTALFLTEARAAAAYWPALGRLVPASLEFPGRRGRGATDLVNTLLNYGYHKLLHLVWEAVDRVGLVSWFGILHTGRRKSPALVLDLMEEFRAVAVDRVVLGLLGRGFVPRARPDGRLSLSTMTTFERAWAANLDRRFGPDSPLERVVRSQASAFRRALEDGTRYKAMVMSW